MQRLPRREPIIAPGGIGRLVTIILTVVICSYVYGVIADIMHPPITAVLDAVLPTSLRPAPHTHP